MLVLFDNDNNIALSEYLTLEKAQTARSKLLAVDSWRDLSILDAKDVSNSDLVRMWEKEDAEFQVRFGIPGTKS